MIVEAAADDLAAADELAAGDELEVVLVVKSIEGLLLGFGIIFRESR